MIVPMRKAYVVARAADRERLLDVLGELRVVHLVPVNSARAVADQKTLTPIEHAHRSVQILLAHEPTGEPPDLRPPQAVEQVLRIHRQASQRHARLGAVHRLIEEQSMWGEVRNEQFDELRRQGLDVQFYLLPECDVPAIEAQVVQPLGPRAGGLQLVAVVDRGGEVSLPDSAEHQQLPAQDRPALRAEAAEIDEALQADAALLERLAHLIGDIEAYQHELEETSRRAVARQGSLAGDDLVALQGWAPAQRAESLAADLAAQGLDAAVQILEPAEGETPPTLIHYPTWTRPIKALFDMLGTLPGYREVDLSPFFMISLPIFAAMLIGDTGYGLLLVAAAMLYRRKATGSATAQGQAALIGVIGVATMIWGMLTGNLFGVTPQQMMDSGGLAAGLGSALARAQVFPDGQRQIQTIMKVSFIFAVIHLSLAQLRQALALLPDLRGLSKLGWVIFLWGVFGIVWYLFFSSQQTPPQPLHPLIGWLLAAGAAMAILFAAPSRNPLKMLGLGLASFPLTALGAFSDTVSYIRLMAVGLASTIIAQTFNMLGAQVAGAATWAAAVPVLLFGHGLNIALCAIAILAHGVRLNMLEFSNNAGVTWAGYAYAPFAKK